jgi:hypothetical protein
VVERLVPLRNLSVLTLQGNPLAELAHARLFSVYQLPSLEVLDAEAITEDERAAASRRFARGTTRPQPC